MCVNSGHEKFIELLSKSGGNFNIVDDYGQTALHIAAKNGNENVTEVLIENGVNINIVDNHGKSALHFAAERG